jgi:hypothetical protein
MVFETILLLTEELPHLESLSLRMKNDLAVFQSFSQNGFGLDHARREAKNRVRTNAAPMAATPSTSPSVLSPILLPVGASIAQRFFQDGLKLIFTFLPLRDAIFAYQTCRIWFRDGVEGKFNAIVPVSNAQYLTRIEHSPLKHHILGLQRLHRKKNGRESMRTKVGELEEIIKKLPNLRIVDCTIYTTGLIGPDSLSSDLGSAQLHTLRVSMVRTSRIEHVQLPFGQQQIFVNSLRFLSSLTTLELRNFDHLEEVDISTGLRHHPLLTSLAMLTPFHARPRNENRASYFATIQSLPKLRELH